MRLPYPHLVWNTETRATSPAPTLLPVNIGRKRSARAPTGRVTSTNQFDRAVEIDGRTWDLPALKRSLLRLFTQPISTAAGLVLTV